MDRRWKWDELNQFESGLLSWTTRNPTSFETDWCTRDIKNVLVFVLIFAFVLVMIVAVIDQKYRSAVDLYFSMCRPRIHELAQASNQYYSETSHSTLGLMITLTPPKITQH